MPAHTLLVTVTELQSLMARGQVRIFDCSFDLTNPAAGLQQFESGHLPGATHADLDRDLSLRDPDARAASGGRHPLPSRAELARWAGQHGIDPGTQVVAYDRQGFNFCGRLWWMLRWLGHEPVALLDGGLQAWQRAGLPLQTGPSESVAPAPPYPDRPALENLLDADAVARLAGRPDTVVLDARAAARYRGEVEPLDRVAGHIPGALNRPFSDNLQADGTFKTADVLQREFSVLAGPSTTRWIHHCGSGVSAIPNVVAQRLAGLGNGDLYAGSWSDWSSDPARPVARG